MLRYVYSTKRISKDCAESDFLMRREDKEAKKYYVFEAKAENIETKPYNKKGVFANTVKSSTCITTFFDKVNYSELVEESPDDCLYIAMYDRTKIGVYTSCENAKKAIESKKEKNAGKKEAEKKEAFLPPHLSEIERTGSDYSYFRFTAGNVLMARYGLRGGEFGNYTSSKDRVGSINMAYDGFEDLYKALGISHRDISLAIMSSNKFDYVVMAVNAIALSFAQKRFFMPAGIASSMKDEMKTRFYFGFLADKQTAGGVVLYLIMLSGVFFLGVAVFLVVFKGKKRAMIAALLLPVIFAFTVSMTPDIAVNHKYIIISTIFLNMIWAYALTRLWGSRNVFLRTLAVLLAITLTATGAYDLLTIYNADKRALKIDMGSSLTEWLKENVKENDLVLTGEESMSEITLSGIMLYNGWPYYAWSAGYDTDTRAANAIGIYSSKDKEKVKELVKKEGIDYVIYEDGMTYEEHECSDEVIKKIYKCVFEKGDVKVYKVA